MKPPTRTALPLFASAASRVRGRLALRQLWFGAIGGGGVACAAMLARWGLGAEWPRLALLVLPGLGALTALAAARARRWSDADVAAYLDARLQLPEVLLTWVHAPAQPLGLDGHAARALAQPTPAPRAWSPRLVAGTAATATLLVLVGTLPAREAPRRALRGTERALPAPSLIALAALRDLPARDEAERERRLALIAEGEKLDAELRRGMSREEAQARLGALRDRTIEEHRSFGDARAGSGLDAAARALDGRGAKSLAEALAKRDIVAFDEELERLAATREKADRASARRALEEAAAAAKAAGAAGVGAMLDQSAKALAERAARNDQLRELAEAVEAAGGGSEDLERAEERLDRTGSAKDAEAMADAMAKALAGLGDEEKARLAKNLAALQKQRGDQAVGGAANGTLDPEALAKQVRELATATPQLGAAQRDGAFRDAERGLDAAGNETRGAAPGMGSGAPGGAGAGAGKAGQGGSTGGGPGAHDHATAPVSASELRARARTQAAQSNPGATVTVFGPGAVGESPIRTGGGGEAARARELQHLDDGELPAEYRDQVRRYFSP